MANSDEKNEQLEKLARRAKRYAREGNSDKAKRLGRKIKRLRESS